MSETSKVITISDLLPVLRDIRKTGRRIVFTNGCFDLLHVGHTRYLQAARSYGDLVIVGVNADASVATLEKGRGRPIVPAPQRVELVAALGCVDYAILFDDPTPFRLIQQIQPDILAKGEDWPLDQIVGRDLVEGYGGKVIRIPLTPGLSTTTLIDRILHVAAAESSATCGRSSDEAPPHLP